MLDFTLWTTLYNTGVILFQGNKRWPALLTTTCTGTTFIRTVIIWMGFIERLSQDCLVLWRTFPVSVLFHFNSRTLSDALDQLMSHTVLLNFSIAWWNTDRKQHGERGGFVSSYRIQCIMGEDKAGTKGRNLKGNTAYWLAFRLVVSFLM